MKQNTKIRLAFVLGITLLLVAGRWLAFWYIERALLASIESLRSSGVTINYTHLDISPWAGDLRFTGLSAQWPGKDSSCHSSAVVPDIAIRGIHLLSLLRRELVVDSIVALRPYVTYSKNAETLEGSSRPGFLKGITVGAILVDAGVVSVINEQCEETLTGKLSIAISHAQTWGMRSDSLRWKVGGTEAKSIEIQLPTEFYKFSVQKFVYAPDGQSIKVDSISMVPTLDRLAFAEQSGHQIDQITCTIPGIAMSGVTVGELMPASFSIDQVALGFILHVYRDKRFPDVSREPTMLPRAFMQQLPLSLRIDSLTLYASSITYAEMPQKGGTPGSILFNALNGSISNIRTDSIGESVMKINARFMDAGDLNAHFTFPMTPGRKNKVHATLSDFRMPAINNMLLPLANLEIHSGHLQALQLAFQYDDQIAIGELDLRYADLNVRSIRQNRKQSTNHMVTLLINTMVQNNMDRGDQKAKRTGTISWKRDPQAGLPSYWWKSILSGLRSVYSLDTVLSI